MEYQANVASSVIFVSELDRSVSFYSDRVGERDLLDGYALDQRCTGARDCR